MSTLMMPAATMTTMTNTAPIAVTQPKIGSDQAAKMVGMITNNNRQGKPPITLLAERVRKETELAWLVPGLNCWELHTE